MKKLVMLGMMMLTLTGCQSLKYTVDQVFGDQSEHGTFQSKDEKGVPKDSLIGNMDEWVKKHLW